jgi:hypothetical protein
MDISNNITIDFSAYPLKFYVDELLYDLRDSKLNTIRGSSL